VAPPEIVFEELKSYSEKAVGGIFADYEKSLLLRGSQLINLGLAQYGADKKIVGEPY
jgi:hypothetical protein